MAIPEHIKNEINNDDSISPELRRIIYEMIKLQDEGDLDKEGKKDVAYSIQNRLEKEYSTDKKILEECKEIESSK